MTTILWLVMTGLTTVTVSSADVNEAQQLSKEGWQLWQKQQFADAEEKFTESVELNPKDADAWNGLGWTQFNGGHSTEAIKAFEQCVKLKPKHPAGLNGLGQIYLMWGDLSQAEKYLKKAAPNAPAAWYGLARLYLIKGDFKKAKPWVERLAEDPNNAEAKQMREAVKNEKLPEDLRIMLEPAGKPKDVDTESEQPKHKDKSSSKAAAALEDLRRTIICYDLSFDQVLSDSLSKYDEGRLELFPTNTSWPEGLMANLVRGQGNRVEALKVDGDAKSYLENKSGTFEFTEPLSAPLRVDNYQTLLFLDGISESGSILIDSYALIYCLGDVEGIINSQSYSTTIVRGNVSGRLRNASYGHWVIFGKFTGKYEQESSGTLRILGGFDGDIKLSKRAKVYLGGKTLASALERIHGTGTVYLEESDLEPGEHKLGTLTVIVGDTPKRQQGGAEDEDQVETTQAVQEKDDFADWRGQLTSAGEDSPWYVGANFGKTLAALPGDEAFRILKPCWSQIADSVRPQILKGFTPGMMGNKKMNTSFFDVMHLGMTDPNPKVQQYAATYLEMQGLPNFADDPEAYAEWLEFNKNRPAKQIVEMAKKKSRQGRSDFDDDDEFREAWQVFFSHDYAKSEEMFRSVLENAPENPHAMNGLGWSLLNQKKYVEAKPWLEKSIAIEKNHWGALTGLAVILREEGNLDQAVAIWERIAENSEGPNDATVNLADYYLERKEFEKAAKCYRKLIEWYPNQDDFKHGLERAEAELAKQE